MKTVLQLGATLDTLDAGELGQALATQTQQQFAQLARGIKYLRFGPYNVPIVSSAVIWDGTGQATNGPREGFVWAIRRLSVWGLTNGSSPDIVDLYRNRAGGIPIWEFNGNNWGYTFSNVQMVLNPGETLSLVNRGTIAATGDLVFGGDLIECAAEQIYKLL